MVHQETGGARSTLSASTGLWMLTLDQGVGRTEIIARNETANEPLLTRRSSCLCFKCLASKPTPFFQTTKVMEAILRASVSRAIEALTPRARQAS